MVLGLGWVELAQPKKSNTKPKPKTVGIFGSKCLFGYNLEKNNSKQNFLYSF
jgi:hypothetical protein